jgi:hypothetical protein
MNKIIFYIFISVFVSVNVFAQEQLLPIAGNPLLESFSRNFDFTTERSVKNTDTIDLPFFDDFAVMTVYPDQSKWIGFDAFVNDSWGVNNISYGVVSLDQADSVGAIRALSSGGEMSDVLTSRPINLNYSVEDSVYLSFAVQRGGMAKGPEYQDSLVLQFSSPDTTWYSVWNMSGGAKDTTFHYFLIPVKNPYLLKKGFQFRFINYASTTANAPEPSFNSNNDIWNIDYVWLDTARSIVDTIINDIAMVNGFSSIISGYESVPWKHYLNNPDALSKDSITFVYRSNGETGQGVTRRYRITDAWGNGSSYLSQDDTENIDPFETISYSRPVNYEFDTDLTDSAQFKIQGFILTDEEEDRRKFRWNDTVYYYQTFQNYYAYDDGIPEVGYGIGGVGTNSASLAYRFETLKPDTLRGVQMYFNKVLNDENVQYFYLMVWADNNGIPGDTLVQQIGVRPAHKDSLFQYQYYALDTPVFVSGAFHVGWTKTTNDMLNVGFDLNRDASKHVNINIFGNWQESSLTGALMIRPILSESVVLSNQTNIKRYDDFELYPNPAKNQFYLNTSVDFDIVKIIHISGKIVNVFEKQDFYNISDLSEGIYMVLIYDRNQLVGRQKLMLR